jgi:putative redox protein
MEMEIEIKKIKGLKLLGKDDSGHEITIDANKEHGGYDSGPAPMSMLLFSLGGCTLMDVISLLDKMHVDYDDIKIQVSGERHDKHPKIFNNIEIKYSIYGENPDESKIKKAIELSTEKYCSVHAMLSKSALISSSYEIIRNK